MRQYALDVAGLSDRGVKRAHNEDAWLVPPPDLTPGKIAAKGRLYVVADGVGGHLAGDVASAMAVEIIQQRYYADPSPDVASSLTAAIQTASDRIDQEAAARSERHGMSTTVTAAVLRGEELIVANVGDSRTYLIRKGHARQVTADHSWVAEQVRVGLITPEEASKHPQRNIITRSLGGGYELKADIFEEQMGPGDSLLLCSDGLSNMVTDEEIGAIVSHGRKAEATVRKLIELAKQRGAPDNVTALLIRVVRRARGGFSRLLVVALVLFGLGLVVGGLALGILTQDNDSESPISPQPAPPSDVSPLSKSIAPTVISSPIQATIPPPRLVWPAEDTFLMAGEHITFVWSWENELKEADGRFIFELKVDQDAKPFLREELALDQRQFVIAQSLEPGRYVWTMSVSSIEGQGASAGRVFVLAEPAVTPTGAPVATPGSPN